MLADAQKGNYAVGAFNVENMEMVKAVLAAAEELHAPVMLQTTPSTVKYGTLETFAAIVAAEAKKYLYRYVCIWIMAISFELAVQAMKAGYTSVMIDGSHEDFEEMWQLQKSGRCGKAFGVQWKQNLVKLAVKKMI